MKKIEYIIIASLSVFLLMGCNSKEDNDVATETEKTSESTTESTKNVLVHTLYESITEFESGGKFWYKTAPTTSEIGIDTPIDYIIYYDFGNKEYYVSRIAEEHSSYFLNLGYVSKLSNEEHFDLINDENMRKDYYVSTKVNMTIVRDSTGNDTEIEQLRFVRDRKSVEAIGSFDIAPVSFEIFDSKFVGVYDSGNNTAYVTDATDEDYYLTLDKPSLVEEDTGINDVWFKSKSDFYR